jgi:hypothetical protein
MGGSRSAGREKLSLDLLMVRERLTGRFVYTEQLERRLGETSWEYVRRSVRRKARVRGRFKGETFQVIVGWGAGSVEEFLESYPEYGPIQKAVGEPGEPGGEGPVGQYMVER